MNRYMNLRVRPDPEFPLPILMGALFGKLHRVLAELGAQDIGVSFPAHSLDPRTLGDVLRVHGDQSGIDRLMARPWLTGMRDHVLVGETATVPDHATHRVVRRRQFKTNVERLRRRRARRHDLSIEQARADIPDAIEQTADLPFVRLRSSSTRHTFCLFIEHGPEQITPQAGTFNRYGLSEGATVPWFDPFPVR